MAKEPALDEIRRLYFNATRGTIQKDIARAIDLLKGMESEEAREKATVFMEGLAQMRSEWAPGGAGGGGRHKRPPKGGPAKGGPPRGVPNSGRK